MSWEKKYTHMRTHMWAVNTHACMHARTHTYTPRCTHTCIHTTVCKHTKAWVGTHTHTKVYTHTHKVYTHTHQGVHIHTHHSTHTHTPCTSEAHVRFSFSYVIQPSSMVAVPNKLKRRVARSSTSRANAFTRQTSAPATTSADGVRSPGLRVSWNLGPQGPHESTHKTVVKQQGAKVQDERKRSMSESCVPTTYEEEKEEKISAIGSIQVPA